MYSTLVEEPCLTASMGSFRLFTLGITILVNTLLYVPVLDSAVVHLQYSVESNVTRCSPKGAKDRFYVMYNLFYVSFLIKNLVNS